MDLDGALKVFDTAEANLRRLEAIWNEMSGLMPTGPSFTDGGDPESRRYRELQRAYEAISAVLPAIGACEITTIPPDLNSIGQAHLDAPDYEPEGEARPDLRRPHRDAVLQPPRPLMPAPHRQSELEHELQA
jgi:hypothetical protein